MATLSQTTGGASFTYTQKVTVGVVQPYDIPTGVNLPLNFGSGTGSNNIDLIYAKAITLVASTPQTLDLTSLTDLSGASINFARVRDFAVINTSTTTGQIVTVGAAATNAWVGPLGTTTSTAIVYPGVTGAATPSPGHIRWTDPYTTGVSGGMVVTGTSKSVKLDPGANTITVYVIIAGCSVA